MLVVKTKWFRRFARKEGIADEALCKAVRDIENGLADADLGGGLFKQRVARQGAGSRGGWRTLVVVRHGSRAIFTFGFAKSDQASLSATELDDHKALANVLLQLTAAEIAKAIREGELFKVECNEEIQE